MFICSPADVSIMVACTWTSRRVAGRDKRFIPTWIRTQDAPFGNKCADIYAIEIHNYVGFGALNMNRCVVTGLWPSKRFRDFQAIVVCDWTLWFL